MRTGLAVAVVCLIALAGAMGFRVARVNRTAGAIPVYPGGREGGGHTRYLPRLISWDDRSSARVRRVLALPSAVPLAAIARHAHETLGGQGWYLVMPEDLERIANPQVVIWQRDPDERLDLTKLWPDSSMTREQRLYGGYFPPQFLDAPLVIEWSFAIGGSRLPRTVPVQLLRIRTPGQPPPTQ